MDGILPILVIVIGVLSAFSRSQKQRNEKEKKTAFPQASVPVRPAAEQPAAAVSAPRPLFPDAVPAAMGREGENACPEYIPAERETAAAAELWPEEDGEAARELVRGVIIGEILSRPRMNGRRRL